MGWILTWEVQRASHFSDVPWEYYLRMLPLKFVEQTINNLLTPNATSFQETLRPCLAPNCPPPCFHSDVIQYYKCRITIRIETQKRYFMPSDQRAWRYFMIWVRRVSLLRPDIVICMSAFKTTISIQRLWKTGYVRNHLMIKLQFNALIRFSTIVLSKVCVCCPARNARDKTSMATIAGRLSSPSGCKIILS